MKKSLKLPFLNADAKQATHYIHELSEAKRLHRMYDVLKELDGMGGRHITDASTTINEVLYGENGTWKGKSE
jgi:hypothetical protein